MIKKTFLLLALLPACSVVDTGTRGIFVTYGKVTGEPVEEGLYFYNPFSTSLVHMDVREHRKDFTTSAYTKDVQQANLQYSLNYYPDATKIHTFYKELGRGWDEKIVPVRAEGVIKATLGKYDAVELVSNRAVAVKEMETNLAAELAERGIFLTKVEITSFHFNKDFEKAVERKVIAVQKADEAKNRTVQVKEEADQQLIAAKAEAESMRIRSSALSQNHSLVEYELAQKWNGKLPDVMVSDSKGGNIFQLPQKVIR